MRIQISRNSHKNLFLKIFCLGIIALFAISASAQKRKLPPIANQPRTITIVTEPKATVWLDEVKRGETDESGKLTAKFSLPGTRKLRVRAAGFKEISQNLLPTQKGDVKITLTKTTDEAELAFQQAESETDKQKAVELYKKAIKLRPNYAEANLGLARVLSDEGDNQGALKAIREARKARPAYAEASAVEGRIYKAEGSEEKAIAAFKRAITEGKGYQPEALTGLALLYKEKAEDSGTEGKFDEENANYQLAAEYFKKAVAQLSGAPDAEVIYQFLGLAYEKMKKYKDAIAVYEEFLRVFPDSSEATAVRSFIVQLKKQMNGEQ
ncbi:MAG: tetratricopeptide repeat protein [Acidobacteria bacterium]|jgi:tetratricopeptide (TPR) repeat protein|nr:tetratricopeptide repeat protein [Acidobacteriota bacterium]